MDRPQFVNKGTHYTAFRWVMCSVADLAPATRLTVSLHHMVHSPAPPEAGGLVAIGHWHRRVARVQPQHRTTGVAHGGRRNSPSISVR
jgi:hypothetical protein